MIFTFTYFICHVRHKLSVTYVTTLHAVIFFVLCSYWKILSTVLISTNRVFFQCMHFQSVGSIFRENSSYAYFFKNGRFSEFSELWNLWFFVKLFQIVTRITWKMLVFTFFNYFFFLRAVFDIFNIIFYFWYLKSNFWGGFPSKIFFWLSCTSHHSKPI